MRQSKQTKPKQGGQNIVNINMNNKNYYKNNEYNNGNNNEYNSCNNALPLWWARYVHNKSCLFSDLSWKQAEKHGLWCDQRTAWWYKQPSSLLQSSLLTCRPAWSTAAEKLAVLEPCYSLSIAKSMWQYKQYCWSAMQCSAVLLFAIELFVGYWLPGAVAIW